MAKKKKNLKQIKKVTQFHPFNNSFLIQKINLDIRYVEKSVHHLPASGSAK